MAFEPLEDIKGPVSLALAVTTETGAPDSTVRKKRGEYRLVVIGDSDFIRNRLMPIQGNADFFLNCVNWLTGEADRVTVRPKLYQIARATISDRFGCLVFYSTVVCLPGLAIAIGIFIFWRRRSL